MKRQNRKSADSFVDGLCLYRGLVLILFTISSVMWLLTLVSYSVVDRGTETFVIVVLNMFGLGGFSLVSGTVLLICRKRGN